MMFHKMRDLMLAEKKNTYFCTISICLWKKNNLTQDFKI